MMLRSRQLTPTIAPLARSFASTAIAQLWSFSRFYGRYITTPVHKRYRDLAVKP